MEQIKVLDGGFIELIDMMGSDLRVVQAARVSTGGESSKGEEKDKRLIRYLMKNKHMTPFEKIVFEFHVKCPIFVGREWMRHRIGCLDGEANIYFDLPSSIGNNKTSIGRRIYKLKIKDLYDKWENGASPIPHSKNKNINIRIPMKDKIINMNVRNVIEETGEISNAHIKDIFYSGKKHLYEVRLNDGKKITLTKEHRVFTESGWKTMNESLCLNELKNGNITFNSNEKWAINGELIYRNYNWMKKQRENNLSVQEIADSAGCSYSNIRKWLKIHNLKFNKEETFFRKGHIPWNKGKTYEGKKLTEEQKQKISERKRGKDSNFWKGGVSSNRSLIGAWTTNHSYEVHKRNNFSCIICGSHKKLQAHHIVPVFIDEKLGYEMNNLTTLCENCHKQIHNKNLEIFFMEFYKNNLLENFSIKNITKQINKDKYKKNNSKYSIKFSKVVSVRYIGYKDAYDIEIEGENKNFIANGIMVHNSYNEASGRYKEFDWECFIPEEFRRQDGINKQGSIEGFNKEENEKLIYDNQNFFAAARYRYKHNIEAGVANELSRIVMPVAQYTEFFWTVNFRSLANFITLRSDSHAQKEIQDYANAILEILNKISEIKWSMEIFSDMLQLERAVAKSVGEIGINETIKKIQAR